MVPEKVKDIDKCQFLNVSSGQGQGGSKYCELYAEGTDTPCKEKIKQKCLDKFHQTSCC